MDELFQELFGVDSNRALNFFHSGLREVSGKDTNGEMLYVASVLAHYSQVPRFGCVSMPPLANLSEVFDNFVLAQISDPEILEIGGSQILLFAGFFRDQMERRHNVAWYDKVGQSFYDRASVHVNEPKKKRLFEKMSESLPDWTLHCRDLSRAYRDNRYVLKIN